MQAADSSRASALGVAAGLVPLAAVVALDPAGWYPFGPAKQGAVFVAALAAVGLAAGGAGKLPRHIVWLWGGLLGWLVLAAALGEDRWYAWIGTPERRLGWLTWALFGACTWAGARLDCRWFSRVAVLAGVWCGGYCLVELWWRVPVSTSADTARLGGPFGSAAYLGAALCLLIPIAGGVLADVRERPTWRALAGASVATGLIALVGSGTRAAWVALGLTAIVVALVARPDRRWVLAGGAALIVAVAVVAPRLDDVAGRAGAGGSSRLAEWEVAARVIAGRPVLGAGPEGYRIVFAEGVDAEYERRYGREVLPDRAHSAPLDLAAIGGIPAAVMYMALIGAVVWRGVRAVQAGVPLLAGAGAAAIAYSVQGLALFPLAELDPTFWLLAGMLLAARNSVAGQVDESPTCPATESGPDDEPGLRQDNGTNHPLVLPQRLGAMVLAAMVFVISVVGVAADRSARTALRREPGSAAAIDAATRAADLRPDVLRYHLLVSTLEAERQSVASTRASVAAAARATVVSPGDPVARATLAEARTRLAQVTGNGEDLAVALADWERLVADDPNCGNCWAGLGTTRLLADDVAGADRAFAAADRLGADR